jgi:hypothetical protein
MDKHCRSIMRMSMVSSTDEAYQPMGVTSPLVYAFIHDSRAVQDYTPI